MDGRTTRSQGELKAVVPARGLALQVGRAAGRHQLLYKLGGPAGRYIAKSAEGEADGAIASGGHGGNQLWQSIGHSALSRPEASPHVFSAGRESIGLMPA